MHVVPRPRGNESRNYTRRVTILFFLLFFLFFLFSLSLSPSLSRTSKILIHTRGKGHSIGFPSVQLISTRIRPGIRLRGSTDSPDWLQNNRARVCVKQATTRPAFQFGRATLANVRRRYVKFIISRVWTKWSRLLKNYLRAQVTTFSLFNSLEFSLFSFSFFARKEREEKERKSRNAWKS